MIETERPLVTFALFAFNQNAYVREAVQAALAQTYSPLQVILSDDCSVDGTFEIMREEALHYSGHHKLELNRNPTNLGLAEHFKTVMAQCQGEFIVVAAGDDISFPSRTTKLFDTWDKEGRRVMSIFSGYSVIDAAGRIIGEKRFIDGYHEATPTRRISGNIPVEGATHAFSKSVYEDFGPLVDNAINEDVILQFRASLRGGVYVLSDKLAAYRKHSHGLSNMNAQLTSSSEVAMPYQVELVHFDRQQRCLKNFSKDIAVAIQRGWISIKNGKELLDITNSTTKMVAARQSFLSQRKATTFSTLVTYAKSGIDMATMARDIFLRYFPGIFMQLRKGKHRVRQLTRSTRE